jgi:hypothetical protein
MLENGEFQLQQAPSRIRMGKNKNKAKILYYTREF